MTSDYCLSFFQLHLPAEIPEKESAEKKDEDAQFKIAAVDPSEEADGSGDSWEDSEEVCASTLLLV